MKIIYIGKSIDSIQYFTSLLEESENYSLVGSYLINDDFKEIINQNDVDCVVIDLNVDDCQDIKFMRYLREIDPYVVIYGNTDVNAYITYTANVDLKYFAFLDVHFSKQRLNNFFSALANNIVEFNVSEFFDAYINDNSIVFDDEQLERFVAALTCRRKKIISADEIMSIMYPGDGEEFKRKIYYHELCFKFYSFLEQIGMQYLFSYNQTKCIFNYHLVHSDYYQFIHENFDNFDDSYVKSFKVDFDALVQADIDNRSMQAALDFDELHYDDEVYVPLLEEEVEDFNLAKEDNAPTETSFLEKAIQKNKK